MEGEDEIKPVKFVDRIQWLALPPRRMVPVKFPIKHILVTLDNKANACTHKKVCKASVRDIQIYYMLGPDSLVDVPYNFLVGYDGRVYEGRGWNVKSHISEYNPEYKEHTIDIGIMGSDDNSYFPNIDFEKEAMTTVKRFIAYWVSKDIITKDYTIKLL